MIYGIKISFIFFALMISSFLWLIFINLYGIVYLHWKQWIKLKFWLFLLEVKIGFLLRPSSNVVSLVFSFEMK